MRRSILLLMLLVVAGAGSFGTRDIHDSLAQSPVTATCTPGPISAEPGTDTAAAIAIDTVSPFADVASEAPLPQKTPPPGTPAGTDLLDRIRAAEANLSACFNAGDYAAFVSLLTPDVLLEEMGIADPNAPPLYSASYLILREELLTVTGAQRHADGRVSAEVEFAFEGMRMRARDIFVEFGGALLLDEIIGLPLSAPSAGTPSTIDPLDVENLAILAFPPGEEIGTFNVATLGTTVTVAPGQSVQLVLGTFDYEICGVGVRCFVPASVRAEWSIVPVHGATIGLDNGILTIDPATSGGTTFTVSAEIAGSSQITETEVVVYTAEAFPLVGMWSEVAQLDCTSGQPLVPELPIEELVFAADGTFAVTWMPFESYVDYWGTYALDPETGTIDLTINGGNDIPDDFDGAGSFDLESGGQLVLTDLWLGTPGSGQAPPNCGHRFA